MFFKKLDTKALKVFFVYASVLALFSLLSLTTLKLTPARTLYLVGIRLFTVLEFSIIATFLTNVLKGKGVKYVFYSIIPLFIIFAGYHFLSSRDNFYPNIVSALILIIALIYFFYEKMKTVVLYPLYQSIVFWICVSFFLYFTGTFFFFLFLSSSTDRAFKLLMNNIYGLVTIFKNILLCLALFATETNEEQEDNILRIPNEIELDEFSLTDFKSP